MVTLVAHWLEQQCRDLDNDPYVAGSNPTVGRGCRCNEVFWTGLKIDRDSFFNVEYWTSGDFSPLKFETRSRWKYTRGNFSTALQMHFFSNFWWPPTCWILTLLNIDPRLQSFEFLLFEIFRGGGGGGSHKQLGGFYIDWTVSTQKSKYLSIIIASYF
jgi:hypothetical protein